MKVTKDRTEYLEYHKNELLSRNCFSPYKYQLSYLAKFTKHINGEEHAEGVSHIFHKWVKSEVYYNYSND